MIGYVLSHYREHVDAAPYELQRGFVARLRDRGIVEGESVRANFTPFLIPVGGPQRQPGRGRVLLAGDAGGFVNGFTAEGIYYAMVSGELAARAVVDAGGSAARMAAAYRRACDYEIGAELRDSVAIQRFLFGDRRRISRVIDGAHREAAMTRLVLDFAMRRALVSRSSAADPDPVAAPGRPPHLGPADAFGREEFDCGKRDGSFRIGARTGPWRARRTRQIEHLLRRAGFGARPDELDTYAQYVDRAGGRRARQLRERPRRRRCVHRHAPATST